MHHAPSVPVLFGAQGIMVLIIHPSPYCGTLRVRPLETREIKRYKGLTPCRTIYGVSTLADNIHHPRILGQPEIRGTDVDQYEYCGHVRPCFLRQGSELGLTGRLAQIRTYPPTRSCIYSELSVGSFPANFVGHIKPPSLSTSPPPCNFNSSSHNQHIFGATPYRETRKRNASGAGGHVHIYAHGPTHTQATRRLFPCPSNPPPAAGSSPSILTDATNQGVQRSYKGNLAVIQKPSYSSSRLPSSASICMRVRSCYLTVVSTFSLALPLLL